MLAGSGVQLPALGNLVANWKADSLALTDGAAVATWTDSISGIVASQGTGANQPTFKASSLGGKPAVVCAGSHWLPIATPGAIDTAITSGNYTIIVAVDNIAAQTNGTVFGASAGGNSQLYAATGSTVGRYDGGYLNHSVPATGNAAPATFTTFGATSQKPYPLSTGGGTGLERIVVRGGIVGGLITPGPAATSTYAIGSLNAGGNGTFNLKGRIYEILFWNRPLTPAELLQVETYLCTKYSQPIPYQQASYFTVFDGDSQTFNVGATGIQFGYPYLSITALGLGYGQWTNTAIGGITQESMIAKMSGDLAGIPALVGRRTVIAAFEYYNSHLAADSGATMYANAGTYVTNAKALGSNVRVVWGSSLSNSSDPLADRAAYDTLLDGTPLGDQSVAQHVDTQIGVSGAEASNPGLYQDGVHLNNSGQAVHAPYWTPKITAASVMA